MHKSGCINVGDRVAFKGLGTWRVPAMDGQYLYLQRKVRGAIESWKVLATRTFT